MSTSPIVQPASRPPPSSLVARRANTAELGSDLFSKASKLGNPLHISSTPPPGGDQTRAAEFVKKTGDLMIDAGYMNEQTKQKFTTMLGMQKLFSGWVDRLWMT